MAVGRIGNEAVKRLEVTGREYCLWDDKLKGFGVKVTSAGAKSYLVQYRMPGRSTRRFTIGRLGSPWTPTMARTEAEKVLQQVRGGVDPLEAKKIRQRRNVDLAFDKYARHFLEVYGPRNWSARTLADNTYYLTATSGAAARVLGNKSLLDIHRSDVAAVFDEVPIAKKGYARNLYSALRKLFAWAVERGDLNRSPMEGFKGPKPVASRDRVLSDEELRLAWLAAGAMQYPFGPAFRLLIATGQRREEVASLEWAHLNREAAEWQIPSEKAKNDKTHVVPLNALALNELEVLAGGTEWPRKGLVFTTTGKTSISGFSRAKLALFAQMQKMANEETEGGEHEFQPWRIHDLRRTFATGMQRLGVRFEVTEAALNHVSGSRSGVAGVYQRHDWRDEKRTALEAWCRHLEQLGTQRRVTNVVSING